MSGHALADQVAQGKTVESMSDEELRVSLAYLNGQVMGLLGNRIRAAIVREIEARKAVR